MLAIDLSTLTKQQRMDQIVRYLEALFPLGQTIEVRIPKATFKRFTAGYRGYFDNFEDLAKAISTFEGHAESIYCTVNPVDPALLARSYNKIERAEKGSSTSDEHITRRAYIPIDVDPVRAAGISSTDAEHAAALARAEQIREYLSLEGWPDPIMGDSGNGAHLLYPVDLPNDTESLLLVEGVLKALDHLFSDERVKVDTTSSNAARIWKVYGTLAAKGSDMPDRPHRWAKLISVPAYKTNVPVDLLKFLAAKADVGETKPVASAGTPGKALDVEAWLHKYGIGYTTKSPWRGGTLWTLDKCHFSADHTDGAWVAQFPSGAVDAGCHHNRCQGKGWRELRELYEGPRETYKPVAEDDLPELTDEEIVAILSGNPVEALPFDLYHYRPEDGGVLDAWLDYHADTWLYVTGHDAWFCWTGSHWRQDQAHTLDREIVRLVSAMNRAAEEKLKAALAMPSDERKYEVEKARSYITATKRNAGRINSVTNMARGFRAAPAANMNGGNLLNLRNGTLDLDTLHLRDHAPSDLLTYCLPFEYDPEATAPIWTETYLPGALVQEHTAKPDPALIALAQELFGYSLTTDTSLEVMVWLYGDGGNGKTVMIEILQTLLGPMATSVDFQNIGLPGNYDLAGLAGMRVALSTESERGGTVAEGYVKKITSGETIKARPIYGSPFDFRSTAKIWWAMNDKPVIKSTSTSMWRRLKTLPFYRKFQEHEKDVRLRDKLMNELPGILNWALEGLQRLRANYGRFTQSATAEAFLKEYEEESNPTQQWLQERTLPAPEPATAVKALYKDYDEWCKGVGRQALNDTNFGRELKRLGVTAKRSNGTKYALFLKPNTVSDASSADDISEALGF